MNLVIIIPVYNSNSLPKLLKNIRKYNSIPIIVIDDGSISPIKKKSLENNILLLTNKKNIGKGASLIKAFNFALTKSYTHAITIDADLQHDPIFINDFISMPDNISIIYGRREFSKSMPSIRRVSNYITSLLVSIICKYRIYDSQCGYRRYRLEDCIKICCFELGFQYETEILIRILQKKLIVKDLKISTIYNDEDSSIAKVKDTLRFIRCIFNVLYKKM